MCLVRKLCAGVRAFSCPRWRITSLLLSSRLTFSFAFLSLSVRGVGESDLASWSSVYRLFMLCKRVIESTRFKRDFGIGTGV